MEEYKKMKGEEGMDLTDGLKDAVKKAREAVDILEDDVERNCRSCGVRYASGKQSVTDGNQKAIADRIPICGPCENNPNMALVKSMGGTRIAERILGKIQDNWRPIADDDKSCQTCKTKRTVDALGLCEEAAIIVKNNCLFCKYSKNVALVNAAHKKVGIEKPPQDNWVNFEG